MNEIDLFRFKSGESPLLINVPHAGVHVPAAIAKAMTEAGLALPDTDRHVDTLYEPVADQLGASLLVATHSRYVVDLNRSPTGESLYPGRFVTPIVPVETFEGESIYQFGRAPSTSETLRRVEHYWHPYHDRLAGELKRIKARHGIALLWDAHSIFSTVPKLFDGRLPNLNFGTNKGCSCDPRVGPELLRIASSGGDFDAVLDGRFTGGTITRHFGRPSEGIHAVQLEMTMATYMQEKPPFALLEREVPAVRLLLGNLIGAFQRILT